MLNLARDLIGLEAAQDGADLLVVNRVQGIEDGLGALSGIVQRAQECRDASRAVVRSNHVKAGVRAELCIHLFVHIAQARVMQLHHNAQPMVCLAQAHQDSGLIALGFLKGNRAARHNLLISRVRCLVADRAERDIIQAVVGSAATHLGEELQPLNNRGAHIVQGFQLVLADRLGKCRHIIGKAGFIDIDGLVRAEGRADLALDGIVRRNLLVPFQGINRVVCRTDERHVGLLNQPADGHIRVMLKLVVALVPDFLVIFSVQVAVYAEILVQLQVAPMVHGVANRHFQRGDKLFKTLNAALIARDIRLGRAIRAHDAPLVVVAEIGAVRVPAAQPNLRQVVKAAVLVNFLRGDVAVVV